MSKIFDALKKAKSEQADMLFRPSTSKDSVARVAKPIETSAPTSESKPEIDITPKTSAPVINLPTTRPASTPTATAAAPAKIVSPVIEPTPAPVQPLSRQVSEAKHIRYNLPKRKNLVVMGDRTLAGEQFAGLRAKLMVMNREQNVQAICVTSSVMGEGKTFVSTNLSLTLAAESQRGGILIDCDLRNPSVHRALGIKDATGLADYLQSDREDIDSIIIDTDHRLSVIPAGRIPKNPLSLLDSDKLKRLIANLKERYDFIILDAPPTAPLPDSDLVASLSDGLLFVIRANQTPLTIIQRSLKMLSKRTIIGTVLNGSSEMPSYSYYYGYGQRDDKNYRN